MRVNVYGEELTSRIELVTKTVEDFTFYAVRFWLKFPNQNWWIHRKVDGQPDDDSTAITFWSTSKEDLIGIFKYAIAELEDPTSPMDVEDEVQVIVTTHMVEKMAASRYDARFSEGAWNRATTLAAQHFTREQFRNSARRDLVAALGPGSR